MATGTAYGSWSSWCEAERRWPVAAVVVLVLVQPSAAYLACAVEDVPGLGVAGSLEAFAVAAAGVASWLVHCETSRASLAVEEETVEPS